MTHPIENCPKYTAEQVEAMADAYFQDTENVDQCGSMLRAYAATLRQQSTNPPRIGSKLVGQQVEKTGLVVSRDLLAIACQARNKESERARKAGLPRNETAELRAAIEAIAPLLRAPAEQSRMVDVGVVQDVRSRLLTASVDPSTCAPEFFTGLADKLEDALAQNAQGAVRGHRAGTFATEEEGEAYSQGWDDAAKLHAERARVPDGWVLVPREPTPEMIDACIAAWQQRLRRKAQDGTLLCGGNAEKSFRENWTAMLNATPDRSIECTVAVAWQHRHTGYPDEWKECTREEFDYTKKQPDCPREGRALYAHAERVRVPQPIIELDECRKVGWNDSAPAYRAGWNACRDAMLAAAPAQPEDAGKVES